MNPRMYVDLYMRARGTAGCNGIGNGMNRDAHMQLMRHGN